MTSAEIATLSDASVIERAADPAQYVVLACERAKEWLANALEHGEIDRIVELKSSMEAIRVYTAQKQLGKDAELSAAEIVRRAERGIGLAIRRGQAAGEIAKPGDIGGVAAQGMFGGAKAGVKRGEHLLRPAEAAHVENRSDLLPIYAVTDGVSDEQFEAALGEAKVEQNLSRANVVRKVRAKREAQETRDAVMAEPKPDPEPQPADPDSPDWIPARGDTSPKAAARRRELISELAERGYSSVQIAERLSVLDRTVRVIAREQNIPIPADVAMGARTRKTIDSNRIIRETVSALEAQEMSLGLVNYDDLDRAEIQNWTASLSESIRVLNRLNKRLKEMVQ